MQIKNLGRREKCQKTGVKTDDKMVAIYATFGKFVIK
jgi:hypothetical protein